jgi:hypothetical protein
MMMMTFGDSWLPLWSKRAEFEWAFEDVKLALCSQFMHELRELMFSRSSQITKLPLSIPGALHISESVAGVTWLLTSGCS